MPSNPIDPPVPATVRVHQTLLKRILDGEYASGDRMPTEAAMSNELQVDRSAIRSALVRLADAGLIIREPGHRPIVAGAASDPGGRSPLARAASPKTIAAIVYQTDTFSGVLPLLRGVQQALRELDGQIRLLMFDTHADSREGIYVQEMQALQALEAEGISGAVFWQEFVDRTTPYAKELMSRGVPLVFVDRFPSGLPCDFVGIDDRMGARDAVARLIELGHKRIACFTHQYKVNTVLQREQGYRDALNESGIAVDPELTITYNEIDVSVSAFVESENPPTAVFAINDLMAYLLYQAFDRNKIRVPEDISILGFDDLEHYLPGTRHLSSVHIPFQRMGYYAMELLLSRLREPNPSSRPYQHILLSSPIVERSSTKSQIPNP